MLNRLGICPLSFVIGQKPLVIPLIPPSPHFPLLSMASDNTPTNKRIRLRIPKDYHQEPVISRLVSDYGLIVNITAAILGANAVGDGWFDLELKGTEAQIQSGLAYLHELELEVWDETKASDW